MRTLPRVFAVVSLLSALTPSIARADSFATLSPAVGLLRPEWTVERREPGRARIVGYLYNENELRNAANVWLRVEQVTPAGAVGKVYQSRIVGDVLSRGRISFDVPVAATEGTYRVVVESVDWVMECR
jgi:hypothetical protein